jgi:hypothetical protein
MIGKQMNHGQCKIFILNTVLDSDIGRNIEYIEVPGVPTAALKMVNERMVALILDFAKKIRSGEGAFKDRTVSTHNWDIEFTAPNSWQDNGDGTVMNQC